MRHHGWSYGHCHIDRGGSPTLVPPGGSVTLIAALLDGHDQRLRAQCRSVSSPGEECGPVKLDMPISDIKRMADAALNTLIEHTTREAVDDEILAYRLQYAGVAYMLGVILTQAHGRTVLGDTTGRGAALGIINEVLRVTGHRMVPSRR
jgi:hypothetical protein